MGQKAGSEFASGLKRVLTGSISNVFQGIFQGIGQQLTAQVSGALQNLGSREAYMNMDGAKAGLQSLGADTAKLEELAKGAAKELKSLASTRELLQSSYDIVSSGFQGEDAIKIATVAKKHRSRLRIRWASLRTRPSLAMR
ncbi:MAG: hypothetical protein HC771_24330 [Synechococcales cyanobacterium CRU_2_2]|nr:hypothetical protein [Synechococcales cyanobacterium CRU_2_2]